MKDYYDIYIFLTKLRNDIDMAVLKDAIDITFSSRESLEYLNDYQKIIDSIINEERIKKQWNIYSNKYEYADGIDFNEVLVLLKGLIEELHVEVVAV